MNSEWWQNNSSCNAISTPALINFYYFVMLFFSYFSIVFLIFPNMEDFPASASEKGMLTFRTKIVYVSVVIQYNEIITWKNLGRRCSHIVQANNNVQF